jgi:hypothetical protein
MTEIKTKHTFIIFVDERSIRATKRDIALFAQVSALMLPFNKSDQVPSKQGVVFRREISA